MHTDTTQRKKPIGDGNPTAGHTDSQTVPDAACTDKMFATLAARFALAGHALSLSNPADGAAMDHAGRWGLSRALPDVQAAAHFLAQIGCGND